MVRLQSHRSITLYAWVVMLVAASHPPTFAQCMDEQKVIASDAAADDHFGSAVSVSENTVLIGAWQDDCTAGADCGAVYVLRYNGSEWIEEQKLTASDADAGDRFGISVSILGETALIGATGDDCADGDSCGSAYLFRYNGTEWVEEQKLTASDGASGDGFGRSSSIDFPIFTTISGAPGILIGAPGDDCTGVDSCGSVYVFRFDGSGWVEEQKLTASDPTAAAQLGVSVYINGDTAVAGAPLADCPAGVFCGAAYIYHFDGSSWTETQKLTASDASPPMSFGGAVAMSGNALLVGAFQDNCEAGIECGAAYVYRFDGSNWNEEQKLTASDANAGDQFARSLSLSGNSAVIGSGGAECPAGGSCGAAYVYRFDGSDWSEEQKLVASDADGVDSFGTSVAMSPV